MQPTDLSKFDITLSGMQKLQASFIPPKGVDEEVIMHCLTALIAVVTLASPSSNNLGEHNRQVYTQRLNELSESMNVLEKDLSHPFSPEFRKYVYQCVNSSLALLKKDDLAYQLFNRDDNLFRPKLDGFNFLEQARNNAHSFPS